MEIIITHCIFRRWQKKEGTLKSVKYELISMIFWPQKKNAYVKLLHPVCPLLAAHRFMQAYKLLSIRRLYILWLQVSKTNKYMPNFKQMSCSKRKGFCEKLELSIFYKEQKHMHCFQMSLLTESKHPDIWIWWCTVLHLNQIQYSCLFNRNTEYLKNSRTIISGQKQLDFLTGFWSFYSGGQQRSSKNRIYSVFWSSWLLQPVFQKKVFWLFLSKSCIEILFLLSKETIHITTSHWHCLINGNFTYCENM